MLIEKLHNRELGFPLFKITEEWQVSEILYCEAQDPEKINILAMYPDTIRTFTLLEGEAFLLATEHPETEPEIALLQPGCTYQTNSGIWHNVSLKKGARVLVTENTVSHVVKKQHLQTTTLLYETLKKHI